MSWDLEKIKTDIAADVQAAGALDALEAVRLKYLGKKGLVPEMYAGLGSASAEEKKALGKGANDIKVLAETLIAERKAALALSAKKAEALDVTLPGVQRGLGSRHLIDQTIDEICEVFQNMGFVIQRGPEIESEFYNFSALNIPLDHPSRDSFDTFYLDAKDPDAVGRHLLLRSHTSPGQVRVMQKNKPPLAVIIPGKVYRPDAVDASHSFMFHQIEGLLVNRNVTFADLKGLLTAFCKKYFGADVKMRFRPHFFPFTEPSAEVDIQSNIFKGRAGKWLEILGCGMVHPKVFAAAGYSAGDLAGSTEASSGTLSGFAFGMGVERIAMLKHGIGDIRTFVENDVRFLKQF
ncbi:MAG: phenylalanine--tRNA ligase subunit alpha [Candidatus Omnitrophica bacterium]|nr:phenylalanine--tRNA ligase subunit alpha [Candidatus Omnitrophota bacterium]